MAAGVAVLALAGAGSLTAYAGSDHGHGKAPDRTAGHHGMGHHGMGHHGMGHRGKSRGPGATMRMLELLETYDADGDGSVTQAEIDRWRADRLAAFDANNDGQLSLDEYEALWLDAMREHMVDRFQGHDDDGDGRVTADEFAQPMSHFVLMRDRNEDGVLNMQDLRRGGRDRSGTGEDEAGAAQQPAPGQDGTVEQPQQ